MTRISLALAAGGAALALATTASAAPVQWTTASGGNGHYYDYIGSGVSWGDALSMADAMSHLGLDGYLVTLTSAEESTFVRNTFTTLSYWAAGSDGETEGVWKWMAGPELGTVFWNAGVTFGYAGWSGGEPNNAGNEDFLQANWSGIAWNDSAPSGLGFVVEYSARPGTPGGVPEPGTWALMILGFGATGAAFRRRRTAALAA